MPRAMTRDCARRPARDEALRAVAHPAAGAGRRFPRVRDARLGLTVALLLTAVLSLKAAGLATAAEDLAASSAGDCQESTITAVAQADSWVDENSPSANKGGDAILSVQAGSPLDPESTSSRGRAHALLGFALPSEVPPGCVVESAKLRLFAPEESSGTKAEAVQLASGWSERSVTWSNQPEAIGAGASAWSTEGYMQWNVTSQVETMIETTNHGFLVRDAAEGAETGAGDHSFHSRENGESPPELVIRFGPPPSGEPPPPPAEPTPAAVHCGQVVTQSVQVTNDLLGCSGDGLLIGAPRIIVDLNGHTIDGVGLGAGIRNDGFASVTVKNGTVQEFDYGVLLRPETELNVVERLMLRQNQLAAIELFDARGNELRANTLDGNGDGIVLVSGTTGTAVVDNTITRASGAGLLVRDSDANRLERNSIGGGGDLGVGLERASGNTLLGNDVSRVWQHDAHL
jgi:large repetitive protein